MGMDTLGVSGGTNIDKVVTSINVPPILSALEKIDGRIASIPSPSFSPQVDIKLELPEQVPPKVEIAPAQIDTQINFDTKAIAWAILAAPSLAVIVYLGWNLVFSI